MVLDHIEYEAVIHLCIFVNEQVAKPGHTPHASEQIRRNDSMLRKNRKDVGVFFGRRPTRARNDVLSNIENDFNRQLEIAFCNVLQIHIREERSQVRAGPHTMQPLQVTFEKTKPL